MRLHTTDGKCDESKLKYPECNKCIYDGKKSDVCVTCGTGGRNKTTGSKGTKLSVVRRMPAQYEDEEPTSVTSLPADAEDKFRTALCELFSLKPLELLVLQGIMRHMTLTEIGTSLTALFAKCGNKDITAHHVFQLRKSMATKMPVLKDALLTAGQNKELKLRT